MYAQGQVQGPGREDAPISDCILKAAVGGTGNVGQESCGEVGSGGTR